MKTIQSELVKIDSFDVGGIPHRVSFFKEKGHPLMMGPRLPYIWIWGYQIDIPSQPKLKMQIPDLMEQAAKRGQEIVGAYYVHHSASDGVFFLSKEKSFMGELFCGVAFFVASELKRFGVSINERTPDALFALLSEKLDVINQSNGAGFYGYSIFRRKGPGEEGHIAVRTGFMSMHQAEQSADLMIEVMKEGPVPA